MLREKLSFGRVLSVLIFVGMIVVVVVMFEASAKKLKLNKSNKSIYINIGKKRREIKSKMCNRIKSAKQIRCANQYTGT